MVRLAMSIGAILIACVLWTVVQAQATSPFSWGIGEQNNRHEQIVLGKPLAAAHMTPAQAIAVAKADSPARFAPAGSVNIAYGSYDTHVSRREADGRYHPIGYQDVWIVHVSGLNLMRPASNYQNPVPQDQLHNAFFVVDDQTGQVLVEVDEP